MLTRAHASLTVAEGDGGVLGYALVLFHEGTSLGRLYSIAIDPRARGIGPRPEAAGSRRAGRAGQRPRLHAPGSAPDNRGAIAPLRAQRLPSLRHRARLLRGTTAKRCASRNASATRPRPAPPRALLPADHRFHLRPGLPADGHGRAATGAPVDPPRGTAPVARGDHHLHDRRARRL